MAVREDNLTLGEFLRDARMKAALSQRALAEQVGCSYQRIGQIEHDQAPPAQELSERLIKALDLNRALFEHLRAKMKDPDISPNTAARLLGEPLAPVPPPPAAACQWTRSGKDTCFDFSRRIERHRNPRNADRSLYRQMYAQAHGTADASAGGGAAAHPGGAFGASQPVYPTTLKFERKRL